MHNCPPLQEKEKKREIKGMDRQTRIVRATNIKPEPAVAKDHILEAKLGPNFSEGIRLPYGWSQVKCLCGRRQLTTC